MRMISRRGAAVAAASLLVAGLASAPSASAREDGVFQDIAGSWSGGGTVRLEGGGIERLRCQAAYNPSGDSQLSISIRCASDSVKLAISSNVVRNGNRISGNWSESTFGASGSVTGAVTPSSITANIEGTGASGRLALTVRGNTQSVNLSTTGQLNGTASVTLRRQ